MLVHLVEAVECTGNERLSYGLNGMEWNGMEWLAGCMDGLRYS